MNELEKRSFYSFLTLYLVSSFLFIVLLGFWYYTAQKHALENTEHYRLEHIADRTGSAIIMAHMHGTPPELPKAGKDLHLALFDLGGRQVSGTLPVPVTPERPDYFERGGHMILVSDAPNEHLNIRYVVVESEALHKALAKLRRIVTAVMAAVALLVSIVAWTLSKLFMRPIHEKIRQTERFVDDMTHELNTPVTALSMATEQAMKKGCSDKTLRHLVASTRQLYDIYRSLTYLNFRRQKASPVPLDLQQVLRKSADYYRPLCESKQIALQIMTEPFSFAMPEAEAQLLFGNLIGNAVKYSPPRSVIRLTLEEGCVTVEDEGIGIPEENRERIFRRFERGTFSGGGFGVGLSVVKRICDEYGIGLSLHSVEGEGTRFRLCFPASVRYVFPAG